MIWGDHIPGSRGRDRISGGAGDDVIFGNRSGDHLEGNEGNDRISGGRGRDYLDGGPGNDELRPDTGKDRVAAGDGDDPCTRSAAAGVTRSTAARATTRRSWTAGARRTRDVGGQDEVALVRQSVRVSAAERTIRQEVGSRSMPPAASCTRLHRGRSALARWRRVSARIGGWMRRRVTPRPPPMANARRPVD